MKTIVRLLIIVLLGVGGYYMYMQYGTDASSKPIEAAETGTPTVTIHPIEHASAVIQWNNEALYTDPVGTAEQFTGQPKPALIFITDIHPDHFSTTTLAALRGDAMLVVPQAVKDLLPEELSQNVVVLKNGEMRELAGYLVTAIAMYNYPEATSSPHTKGRGNGYVIEKNKFRLYIAGDTGPTPEMKALRKIDLALIPMNLPYTMSVQDAASAVLSFKPTHVYPYHYRGPDGLSDIHEFKRIVNEGDASIDVQLLNWYPSGPKSDGSDS